MDEDTARRLATAAERIADSLEALTNSSWTVRPGVRGILSVRRERIGPVSNDPADP